MVYPYRFNTSRYDINRILNDVKFKGFAFINNKQNSKRLAIKLRPIRKDIYLTYDPRTGKRIMSINPLVTIDIKKGLKSKNRCYYIFRKL